jgi:hypothetical protein
VGSLLALQVYALYSTFYAVYALYLYEYTILMHLSSAYYARMCINTYIIIHCMLF